MELLPLEEAVIRHALAGTHPVLEALRDQWRQAAATVREASGKGVFVTIEVPDTTKALTTVYRVTIADVVVDLPGEPEAIGAVLFVDYGKIAMLELYAFEGAWPSDVSGFRVRYAHDPRTLESLNRVEV